MNCKQFAGYLEDYFEGSLSEDLRTEIEEHIVICNYCAADFNKMKLYFEKVASLPMTFNLPKSWSERILAKFSEDTLGENNQSLKNTKDKVSGAGSIFSKTGEKNKSKKSYEVKTAENSNNPLRSEAEQNKKHSKKSVGVFSNRISDNEQLEKNEKKLHPILLFSVILLAFAILIYTILHYSLKVL